MMVNDKSERVFNYIVAFMRENCGVPPTVREIREAVDISSSSMVNHYLGNLEKAGRIRREPGVSRNIRLPGASWHYVADSIEEPNLPERPTVVCLCGSTRFYKEYQHANYEETLKGKIVLSVGFHAHASKEVEEVHGENGGTTAVQKAMLDNLHLQKIELADEILVINVGGYIGLSTANQIRHAQWLGKRIRYLVPPELESWDEAAEKLFEEKDELWQRLAEGA